jgi:antagonist of KipI
MSGQIRVVRPGLLTTVQDAGRPGHQHDGVSVGGALDPVALRVANLLVGNTPGSAGLEATLLGPDVVLEGDVVLALAGGDLGARLDDAPVPPGRAVRAPAGARLHFAGRVRGARQYVAFAGGIDVPEVLGSRATWLRARMGGLEGRALLAGDVLRLGHPTALGERIAQSLEPGEAAPWSADTGALAGYGPSEIRVLRGAHFDALRPASREALLRDDFVVRPDSDRMGYRLAGPVLELEQPLELLSEAVAFGTVQLPPDGAPIVLMADRQTTGGYPRVLEVATVDLPRLAQAAPGDRLAFREISLEQAQALYIARERRLARLPLAIDLHHR